MSLNPNDIVNAISSYNNEQKRACPGKFLKATYGDDVGDVLKALKESGIVIATRGRTGGYKVAAAPVLDQPVASVG